MLVLSRKRGEKIVVETTNRDGDVAQVTFEVLSIVGGTVRLGISAPPEFRIGRPDAKTGPKKAK